MSSPRTTSAEGRVAIDEEQFRLLVESVRDYAIFILDPQGNIRTWNAGARKIKGYEPEEIIGKHMSIFYPPEDVAAGKPQRLLASALAEGRVEDEGWRLRKDGSRFWADVVITALRGPSGKLEGFAKVTRDLTARREAEEALRLSEERLAATLLSIGDGMIATDQRGVITLINLVASRLTGWFEKDAIGRPIDEVFRIINEDTRARAANPVTRVLAEGVVVGLANHTALLSRDGTERPIADSGAPIRDAQGVTQGTVLIFRDVSTERSAEEALRQSEERLRLMLASIRDCAIFLMDTSGKVTSWNPGAERITGHREDQILGADFACLFPPEDVAAGKPAATLAVATAQGGFAEEAWSVRKDGSRFWAHVTISPVNDSSGGLVGFTGITRDLTERRRMEEEHLRLAQAQEAIRLRDEFLSIASHELKTPLTALLLQLHLVREGLVPIDSQLAKRMERAERAGDRLSDLIEALLDVARISRGQLELKLESFDLAEVVNEVVDRVRDSATRVGCDLTVQVAQSIVGRWDRLRVEQILTNLLANAFKYAPGSPVEVLMGLEGETALLQVRDHGPGISESDLSRIFGRFERSSSTNHGGMGLGLYIARQIAEAHGGTINASQAEGGGALFAVRLPLVSSSPSPAPASAS